MHGVEGEKIPWSVGAGTLLSGEGGGGCRAPKQGGNSTAFKSGQNFQRKRPIFCHSPEKELGLDGKRSGKEFKRRATRAVGRNGTPAAVVNGGERKKKLSISSGDPLHKSKNKISSRKRRGRQP